MGQFFHQSIDYFNYLSLAHEHLSTLHNKIYTIKQYKCILYAFKWVWMSLLMHWDKINRHPINGIKSFVWRRKYRTVFASTCKQLFLNKNCVWRTWIDPLLGYMIYFMHLNDVQIPSGISRTLFHLVMILPQVHLRKPCYDFYFL